MTGFSIAPDPGHNVGAEVESGPVADIPNTGTTHQSSMLQELNAVLACPGGRITLSPVLEQRFEAATTPTRIASKKHFLLIALLVDVCALGLDYAHGALHIGLLLRLGIVAPALAAAIALLSAKRSIWQQGALTSVPVFLGITSIAAIGLFIGGRFAELYLSASGMVAFLVNAVLPLRFWHASLLTVTTIVATTVMVFAVPGPTDPETLVGTLAFNATVMLMTLSLNHRHEKSSRIAFLHELRCSVQKEAMDKLNQELEISSRTDPLTGVLNRRAMEEAIERSKVEARGARRSFGLLMIDIDHFKLLNDTFGHAEGDRCLCSVAEAIRSKTRTGIDTVARFGGEEFAVVIPGGNEEAVTSAAERIRAAVESLRIPHPEVTTTGHVTVSVGGALSSAVDEWNVEGVMSRADAALYVAKSRGRNRIVINRISAES